MTPVVSREELEALVGDIHHVREEHRRAHERGTTRRRLRGRLLKLEDDFERLLAESLPDEAVREAWRARLHRGGPEPQEPAAVRPLAYRGRSDAGSTVEVTERGDGTYDVRVDGCLLEIAAAGRDFAGTEAPHTFVLDDRVFRETFAVSAAALAALEEFVAGERERPPWRHAGELVAEGLVDRTFALTPRGRRALAASELRRSAAARA